MSFEKVTEVEHYTDRLFRFKTTRSTPVEFKAGQFCMIAMPDKKHKRAYSYTNAPNDDHYEFYSIKVPDGPLTSELQKIQVGDEIWVGEKAAGTLVVDQLTPGNTLWLLSTGTGIAPFVSILRDPETFKQFKNVVVTHTVREVAELAAYQTFVESTPAQFYPTVTQEEYIRQGRLQEFIKDRQIFHTLGLPMWHPDTDRIMLCGSEAFNQDFRKYFTDLGFEEGSARKPGTMLVEKAFVAPPLVKKIVEPLARLWM